LSLKWYYKHWDDLPGDAYMLVALMAPRPVVLNTVNEGHWSDLKGEFLVAQAASLV
jgi:hypothetical protein